MTEQQQPSASPSPAPPQPLDGITVIAGFQWLLALAMLATLVGLVVDFGLLRWLDVLTKPYYRGDRAVVALLLVLPPPFIAAGVGLLRRRTWAWQLGVILCHVLTGAFVSALVIVPLLLM